MMNGISLAQVLPGATGVEVMGFIGFKLHKLWGGILAPFLYILPATILVIILAWSYFTYGNLALVKALFAGLGALVVAMLVNATFSMSKSVYKKVDTISLKALIISLIAFVGIYLLKINVVWIILVAGSLGFVFYYFTNDLAGKGAKKSVQVKTTPSVSEHQRLKLIDFTTIGLLAGVFAIGLLVAYIRHLITTFLGIGAPFSFRLGPPQE